MTVLPITSLFAAAFAIFVVALSFPISLRRAKVGQMAGDSADEALRRPIRTQDNFIEYVPLGVISPGLVEAHAAAARIVVAIGTALAFGRLLHAIGMLGGLEARRGFGMLFTYAALLVAAGCLFQDAAPWSPGRRLSTHRGIGCDCTRRSVSGRTGHRRRLMAYASQI